MNKALIYKRFGKLKKFIEKASDDSKWEIENGAIISGDIALDKNDDERIELLNCSVNDVVVVFGFGTGKTIESILDKYKKSIVITIETIPAVLKAAVDRNDEVLLNPRFFIAAGDTSEIEKLIDAYLSIFGERIAWGEVKQLVLKGYAEPHFQLDELQAYLKKSITPIIVNRNTLMLSSEKISDNYIKTAAKLADSHSVLELKDKFRKKPAIVVASGPSLNVAIEDIKATQGKAIIIAADSALSILKTNGIIPDYVCSVDYTQPNLIKFRSILSEKEINGKLSLITVPDVYHIIPYLFDNYYYVPKKSFFYAIDKNMPVSMDLPMNAVSHLSLSIAVLLGADPIIMAGYDWSYPEGKDHAVGAEMENIVNQSDITVESNSGDKVMTDPNLLSGLKITETIIGGNNRKFINISRTGAKISGTEAMSMKNAADQFCKNFIEKPDIKKETKSRTESYENTISAVKTVMRKLNNFIKQSEKGIGLNKKSIQHWKNEAAIRPFVEKSNKINYKITDDPVFKSVLSQHYFKRYYEFFKKEFDIEGQSIKERINRSDEYFNIIKTTSAELLPSIKKLNRVLEYYKMLPSVKRQSIKDMILLMEECGDIYGAKSILDRLIESDSKNAELYYLRAKVCSLNQFMHTEAMADYKKAKELGANGAEFYDDYKQEEYRVPALCHIADAALKRGSEMEARRTLQMAADCEPENSVVKEMLHKLEAAERAARLSKEQNRIIEVVRKDNEYLSKKAQIEKIIEERRTEDAIPLLNELTEKYPKAASNLFLLGSIYLDKKEYALSEKWLKKAWELAPFNAMIAAALGKLYWETDDYAGADRFFKDALMIKPDLTELYDKLGDIAYEGEQYTEAMEYYNQFLKQSGDLETAKKIAFCYKAMGNTEAYELLMKKIEEAKI